MVNNKYKDSVFTLLFSSPDNLRELYGAIKGVAPGAVININTLSDVLYMKQCNDISFTVDDRIVVLIEHQSTVNPNMPLRLLEYAARVYEKIVDRKTLYRNKLVGIPNPEFIVLYNGAEEYPDEKTLLLSDAFKNKGEGVKLELEVKVYNINMGRNEEMVKKSVNLEGYGIFVESVRRYGKEAGKEEALEAAIRDCIERGVLREFLLKHSSEVVNMLLEEWNMDDAMLVSREEGLEEGLEKGRAEVLRLIEQGYGLEDIKERLATGK
jgi:hypothetical protein